MSTFATAESPTLASPKRASNLVPPSRIGRIQTKLAIGSAGDSFEQEAESTADAVVRSSAVPSIKPIGATISTLTQRAVADSGKKDDDKHAQRAVADAGKKDDEKHAQRAVADPGKKNDGKPVQRKAAHAILDDDTKKHDDKVQMKAEAAGGESAVQSAGVPAGVEAQIDSMSSGGDAMSRADRNFFESRFGYTFSDVRLHSDANAAQAAQSLNAKAFTVGQHIFFGHGEFRPRTVEGGRLMAHELTHTVQQSAPAARTARRIQRGLLDSGKDWVLGKIQQFAAGLPGYRLLTVVLGRDPITDKEVEASAENIVHGVLDFVPGGEDIFQNLQENKTIAQFADYFNQQVTQLNLTWPVIKGLFQQAWDALNFTDIADPSGAWEKLKAIFGPPLGRLKTFAVNVGTYILDAIKKKVLEWLKDWATKMKGYPLLTFILGKDPFTDEVVERTPTTFVHAVLDVVPGGDKIFEDLQKSHTIEKTVDWLNKEIIKLDLTWEKIKALFRRAWDVISLSDLLHPLQFVDKIRDIFGAPVLRVLDFAVAVGKKVLEFIFDGVMMLAGPLGQRIAGIFTKASAAFSKIVADPVAFLGHLLDAVQLGFKQFVAKIGEYLQAGVIAWLTGSLAKAGVVLPKVWDLKGILSLVLQILGITYQKIRGKVVKALGENGEKIVSTAEKVWSFLIALITDGPAAAWAKITEALGNFWDMVIGGIKNWAIVKIIKVAVAQLVMMFNPVGAVVEAIIETYRTVEFFIKRINQILDLVEAVVDSISSIANGQIAAAANYVEKTLARTVPVIIGFLASLVGLDDVSDGIRDTIEALQAKVDEGIDKAIAWIVEQIKKLFGKDEDKDKDAGKVVVEQSLSMEGEDHTITAKDDGTKLSVTMASGEGAPLWDKLQTAIGKVKGGNREDKDKIVEYLENAQKQVEENAIRTEWHAADQANVGLAISADFLGKHIANVVDGLKLLASLEHIKELEDLWKGVPAERYLPLPIRERMREKFYEDLLSPRWATLSKQITAAQKPGLISEIAGVWATKNQSKWTELQDKGLADPTLPMYSPEDAEKNVEYAVDHEPPLAAHWYGAGYDSGDNERRGIGNGTTSTLTLVTKVFNSIKGAGGYEFKQKPWVGPNFTNQDADGGAPGAHKIEGQPFIDANGKPLA